MPNRSIGTPSATKRVEQVVPVTRAGAAPRLMTTAARSIAPL
jgi:hypothetical protein